MPVDSWIALAEKTPPHPALAILAKPEFAVGAYVIARPETRRRADAEDLQGALTARF